MRILTYKRTHTGDPNPAGHFGVNDCMGRVRSWNFDAVIGIGGTGVEPRSYGIEGRVNWVGRGPTWQPHPEGYGLIVTFSSFTLLDDKGPLLADLAPMLARRMYENGARVLLKSYSQEEKAEAEALLVAILGRQVTTTKMGDSSICRSKVRVRKACRDSAQPCLSAASTLEEENAFDQIG